MYYIAAEVQRRHDAVMHALRQLRQHGTTAEYTRNFYHVISSGTPGISEDTLKHVFVLGLRSPHLRRALMQLPLRHMDIFEVTDNACVLAMREDY
jgi:hypothetical protein